MKNFEELMSLLPNKQQMEEQPEMAEEIVEQNIEEKVPQEQQFDPQIQEAIDRRNKLQLFGNLLNATSGVTEAATGFKPSNAVSQNLIEQGQQGIEDVQRERQQETRQAQLDQYRQLMQQRQLQLENQELLNNPESPASKISQRLADQLAKQQGLNISGEEINQMSAAQLETIFPELRQANNNLMSMLRLQQGQERLDFLKQMEERRREGQTKRFANIEEKEVRDAIQDVRKTSTWKDAEKTISEVPGLRNLLEDAYQEGGQSLAMLGPKVARSIANEVGVLTEQDVTRYVQNPTLVGSLIDTTKKLSEGKISEVSYENLQRLLDISEQEARRKQAVALDREAELFARRTGRPKEDVLYLLDETVKKQQQDESKTEETKKPEMVKMRIPDGRIKMIPADKVEAAKKAGAEVLD